MQIAARIAAALALLLQAGIARAQNGTLDQISPPAGTVLFNGTTPAIIFQPQVTAGLAGPLEGVRLLLGGAQGATLDVRIRMGPGWNTTPPVFQGSAVKQTAANEFVFVDMTSAGIIVAAGAPFVIEIQGTNNGCAIYGSQVSPTQGPPLYPDPLFVNGQQGTPGYRIAFWTYVLNSAGSTAYCSGDGSATPCPCGNPGAAGNGCANSIQFIGGARLGANGNFSITNDSGVLSGRSMPDDMCLYFQGTLQTNGGSGAVFGDGLRCASGTIIRLGTTTNVAGSSQYPAPGDQSISVRGLVTSPGMRAYQVWYRNAAVFCTPSTFNLSNGVSVNWQS